MQTWQFIALIASVLLSGGGVLLAVLLTNKKNGGIGEMRSPNAAFFFHRFKTMKSLFSYVIGL